MIFDSLDVIALRQLPNNKFFSIILKEIGHVMGIGTLWERNSVTGPATANCPYNGINGNREYSTLSGCSTNVLLPIEQDGDTTVSCRNFDEECFNDEIMTSTLPISSSTMPIISRLTVATLQDLGYTVNYPAADLYSTSNMNPNCVCSTNTNTRRRRDGSLVKIVKSINLSDNDDSPSSNTTTTTTMSSFLSKSSWRNNKKKKRILSNDGYKIAQEFGKKILRDDRIRYNRASAASKQKSHSKTTATYVGSDFISILYNDKDNGLFNVIVTSNDL
jgi:Leishmanolysin